jgi:hypothetical protein
VLVLVMVLVLVLVHARMRMLVHDCYSQSHRVLLEEMRRVPLLMPDSFVLQ